MRADHDLHDPLLIRDLNRLVLKLSQDALRLVTKLY